MLLQIFFFALGSVLCGAAKSVNFLIAGRSKYALLRAITLTNYYSKLFKVLVLVVSCP